MSADDLLPDLPGAVCASVDPALFFGEPHDRSTVRARAICGGCPERVPCLQWALTHHERGTWAGTTEREREVMRRGTRDRASSAREQLMQNRRERAADARLYATRGLTTEQIAERLGVTARAVQRYLDDVA